MELLDIRLQIHRDYDTSQSGDGRCSLIKGESGRIPDLVLHKVLGIRQDLRGGEAGLDGREQLVDDLIDGSKIRLLSLLRDLLDHQPLPLSTGEVAACRGPDPGIGGSLDAVQLLQPRLRYGMGLLARHTGRLFHEFIQRSDLLRLQVDLNAAQEIDGIGDGRKVHSSIILDIQIQVLVQHVDSLGWSAEAVGRVTFLKLAVLDVQDGIPVNGDHADLLGLIVQAGDDDTVAAGADLQLPAPGVDTKKGYIGVPLARFFRLLVYYDIFRRDLLRIQLVQLGGRIRDSGDPKGKDQPAHADRDPLSYTQAGEPVARLPSPAMMPAPSSGHARTSSPFL